MVKHNEQPGGASFSHGAHDTILLLDESISMNETDYPPSRLKAAQACSREYLNLRLHVSPNDRISIVSFARHARILCGLLPLKSHADKVRRAIDGIKSDYCTNIGDGLIAAKQALEQVDSEAGQTTFSLVSWFKGTKKETISELPSPALRRIVLLSDGCDNGNSDPVHVAKILKKSGVLIDCIGIGGSPRDVDERLMRKIASPELDGHGERYRFIKDREELMAHFRRLALSLTR